MIGPFEQFLYGLGALVILAAIIVPWGIGAAWLVGWLS
jgi:hypothetical protein